MKHYIAIVVEDADTTQLNLIHEAIKSSGDPWWHQAKNTWIVHSDRRVSKWRDELMPFLRANHARILVLRLKDTKGGRFASSGWNSQLSSWFKGTDSALD